MDPKLWIGSGGCQGKRLGMTCSRVRGFAGWECVRAARNGENGIRYEGRLIQVDPVRENTNAGILASTSTPIAVAVITMVLFNS